MKTNYQPETVSYLAKHKGVEVPESLGFIDSCLAYAKEYVRQFGVPIARARVSGDPFMELISTYHDGNPVMESIIQLTLKIGGYENPRGSC